MADRVRPTDPRSAEAVPSDDATLVAAWDAACDAPPWCRGAILLDALLPSADGVPAVDQPLGAVTRRFLDFAETWFGPTVGVVIACESCTERLELDVAIDDLRALGPADPSGSAVVLTVRSSEALAVRPLTLTDLAVAASAPGAEAARVLLAARAVTASGAAAPSPESLTSEMVSAITDALDDADPLAAVSLALTCPSCGTTSEPTLDVGAWCWDMVDATVRRLLDEVHMLASAYGWSETAVLDLGPHRRAHYLGLVR